MSLAARGIPAPFCPRFAGAVVALEDDPDLAELADAALTDLEVGNAAVLTGDLAAGVPTEAPFDVIVVEGAVDVVPEKLLGQLKEGGRLVTGISNGHTVVATLFIKTDNVVTRHEFFDVNLPLLSAFAAPAGFAF